MRVDQAGVLPDPAQAGAHGKVTFQQGTGIRVPAVGDGLPGLRFDEGGQRLQLFGHHQVVIRSPGVCGHPACSLISSIALHLGV